MVRDSSVPVGYAGVYQSLLLTGGKTTWECTLGWGYSGVEARYAANILNAAISVEGYLYMVEYCWFHNSDAVSDL